MDKIRQNVFPILTALIWGTAFSAQSQCAAAGMQTFTFNMLRSVIGCIVLVPVMLWFSGGPKKIQRQLKDTTYQKNLLWGGLCCGLLLTIASNLQQLGLGGTESGKGGFITALYIVIVPVLGIFLKKKVSPTIWISVLLAAAGMYLLCVKEGASLTVSRYDLYLLLCALIFALHILVIDRFANRVDGIQLSLVQFAVAAVFSGIGMLCLESPSAAVIRQCLWPLLYVGVFSSGIAYTLQILAQKGSNPTVVSLLLSLESVFSVLSAAIFLGEILTPREYLGCGIMLTAVILAQLPRKRKEETYELSRLQK